MLGLSQVKMMPTLVNLGKASYNITYQSNKYVQRAHFAIFSCLRQYTPKHTEQAKKF